MRLLWIRDVPCGHALPEEPGPAAELLSAMRQRHVIWLAVPPGERGSRFPAAISCLYPPASAPGTPAGEASGHTAPKRMPLSALLDAQAFDGAVLEGSECGSCIDLLPPPLRRRTVWYLPVLDWVEANTADAAHRGSMRMRPWSRLRLSWLRSRRLRQAQAVGRCAVATRADQAALRGAAPCLAPVLLVPAHLADAPDEERIVASSADKLDAVLQRLHQAALRPPPIPGRAGRPLGHWWIR